MQGEIRLCMAFQVFEQRLPGLGDVEFGVLPRLLLAIPSIGLLAFVDTDASHEIGSSRALFT